jgi:mitochondrial inner membrane protein COX18
VTGLMAFNVWWSARSTAGGKQAGKWRRRITGVLYGVSGLTLLVTPSMPAGLVLYWASGSASASAWHLYQAWKYPTPPIIVACKRPLLVVPPVKGGKVIS